MSSNASEPTTAEIPDSAWIAVSDRKPVATDADELGDVLWLRSGHWECLGRVSSGVPVDATHWRATARKKSVTAIVADIERAHDMVTALCQGEREWRMSIPARPDYDPDLVISTALTHAKRLATRVTELERAQGDYTTARDAHDKAAEERDRLALRVDKLYRALRLTATRLEILTGRMRACHEETGKHELLDEAEAFCREAREALSPTPGAPNNG